MKDIINKRLYYLIGSIIFIVVWQIISMIYSKVAFIIPSPIETFKQAFILLSKSYVYKCIFETIIRMILGFVISFILAFILGVLAGNFIKLEYILKPSIIALRSIPTASLVYLFLLMIGAKLTPMLIVVLIAFPILYENILNGIKQTPRELIEASLIDGASRFTTNTLISIPLSRPYILTGIASSFSLSLKIEIMAEVITGYTRLGIGSAILASQRSNPTNLSVVFGYSLIAIILMMFIDELIYILSKNH